MSGDCVWPTQKTIFLKLNSFSKFGDGRWLTPLSEYFAIYVNKLWDFNSTMTNLTFPFTEEKIRALKVGDEVLISGIVFTGRDAQDLPASSIDGRFFA